MVEIVVDQHGVVVIRGTGGIEQGGQQISLGVPDAGVVLADAVQNLLDMAGGDQLYNMNEELDDTYKAVFRQCYPKLLFYATRLVGTEEAEDVVQDVFVELWRRRDSVVIGEQILAFLYRSVYTKAINLLKHQVIENNYSAAMIEIYERKLQYYQPDHAEVIKKIENQELRQEIFEAINELPDKCKEVFKLSYLHDMKNKEIADTLGISLRTVEAHMYKALKFLRERLSHLLLSLIIFSAKLLSVFTS